MIVKVLAWFNVKIVPRRFSELNYATQAVYKWDHRA